MLGRAVEDLAARSSEEMANGQVSRLVVRHDRTLHFRIPLEHADQRAHANGLGAPDNWQPSPRAWRKYLADRGRPPDTIEPASCARTAPPRRSRPLAATHCFLRRLVASCGRRLFTHGAGHSCDPRLSRTVNAMRACGLLWKPSGTVCRRRAAAQFQRPRAKAVSAIATPRGGHADVSAALMALGEASHLTEGAFGVSRFLPA